MKHELKTWPAYFQVSWVGKKTFEIRKNDRHFTPHDEVVLQEWDPETKEYTGREIEGYIEYITDLEQQPGYVVFQMFFSKFSE